MNQIIRIGIDIAKRIFFLYGVDANGKTILRKKLSRTQFLEFFAQLTPCLIAMEACGGAHFWARQLQLLGHDARLIPAQFVAPYRKNQKNDYNDAEAICEAASRPNMRFTAIKSEAQQATLMIHRVREQYVSERTSTANQIHGHLLEFGIVVQKGIAQLEASLPEILDDRPLPADVKMILRDLLDNLQLLNTKILRMEKRIQEFVKQDETATRLITIKRIGLITASAIVATVGNARQFDNSRQFSAWLGLVPKQYSSGGKTQLGGITKHGDGYLRKLLIQGARAVLFKSDNQEDSRSQWINKLRQRKPDNVVATALAAKIARTAWAIMISGQTYQEERLMQPVF